MHFCQLGIAGSFIRRQFSLKWVLVAALATFAAWKFFAMRRRPKYAAFQLNNAQFSDQLFDVCIGLGIAKLTSRRFHPIEMVRQEAADLHLRTVAAWFPKLKDTMAQIKKSVVEKHTIPYVAPARQAISNTTNDDSIVLLFDERYTQEMWLISENEDELRNLLQYDDRTIEEAQKELWKHKIYNSKHSDTSPVLCVHLNQSKSPTGKQEEHGIVKAARSLAQGMGAKRFFIFAEQHTFAAAMEHTLRTIASWQPNVYVSDFTQEMETFVVSQLCDSVLLTDIESKHSFWIGFFAKNQSAVYYLTTKKVAHPLVL
ncbi:hypothetical protein Q1695_008932 [Nippostrongylus brasiliensis]|nr:hypothetical protein Q1695_008932 [Nippostrongylus brasiliensis]